MKAAIHVLLFGLIFMLVSAGQYSGSDSKAEPPSGQKPAIENRDQRQKSETARSEWFADPQRGWIRADQRDNDKNRDRSRARNSGGKSAPQVWEY